MKKRHKARYKDKIIEFSIFLLCIFGTMMVMSASVGLANGSNSYLTKVLIKQIIYVIAGGIAMTFAYRVFNTKTFKPLMQGFGFIMTILLLSTMMFSSSGGANAWIKLSIAGIDASIQPAEFAKVLMIAMVACCCGDIKKRSATSEEILKTPFIFLTVYAFIIIFLQRDLGSAIILIALTLLCFLMCQHPSLQKCKKFVFWAIFAGILAVIFLMSDMGIVIASKFFSGYKLDRIISATNPFADQYGSGYHIIIGMVAIGRGGVFGLGYGNSIQKYANFPAANTDFILAIIMEELGIFGLLIIIILYGVIIVRLFYQAVNSRLQSSKIILIGTALYIFIHFFFNVGGMTGLIPLTGVPLLLISAGGSSAMSLMLAIGMCQAVINREYNIRLKRSRNK